MIKTVDKEEILQSEQFTAVIDSGIGGLTVLADAIRQLPDENLFFFADCANAPYGDRRVEDVMEIVEKYCQYFIDHGAKAILIACNTATSAAASSLRSKFTVPILGMEPALKPAVSQTTGTIIVLGTSLTIREKKFQALLQTVGKDREIIPLPCPGLMEIVEVDPYGEAAKSALHELLDPFVDMDVSIVLGCTHYVFLRRLLRQEFPQSELFDGNLGVVRHWDDVLTERRLRGGSGKITLDCSFSGIQGKAAYLKKCRERLNAYSEAQS